jgi:hypothetical protein
MNIRSIDLQVLIPRATEAGKVQQVTNHQSVLDQQQFAAQFQAIAKERQQQVQDVPKTESGKIHNNNKEKEHKNNQQQGAHLNKHPKNSSEQEESITDPLKGHIIDIKT